MRIGGELLQRLTLEARNVPVALDQDSTLIAVIEMSQSSWLVAGKGWDLIAY